VTAFVSAGVTNQVISLLHLLRVAIHTKSEGEIRTPILPPFAPIHVNRIAGFMPFGDVFDVPRLSTALGIEILEWRDLKIIPKDPLYKPRPQDAVEGLSQTEVLDSDDKKDELGCWSLIMTQFPQFSPEPGKKHDTWPWHGDVPSALGLDVAWTAVPSKGVFTTMEREGSLVVDLGFLELLGDEKRRDGFIEEGLPIWTETSQHQLKPDTQLLCFDFLYYTAFNRVGTPFFP
jgi:hypothetical protein